MSTLFIFDIDGCLANATKRFAQAGHEPSRSDRAAYLKWLEDVQDERRLMEDPAVPGMASLVTLLSFNTGPVFYVTSREEKYRSVTRAWLGNQGFPSPWNLYMRGADDWRSSGELKEAIIKVLAVPYTSVVIVDDDPRGDVEQAAHRNGWTFLKACSGGRG